MQNLKNLLINTTNGVSKIEECYYNSVSEWEKAREYHDFGETTEYKSSVTHYDKMSEEEIEKGYIEMDHQSDFGVFSDEEILLKRNKELEDRITELHNETEYKKVQALKKTLENAHKVAQSKGFTFETVEAEKNPDDDIPF